MSLSLSAAEKSSMHEGKLHRKKSQVWKKNITPKFIQRNKKLLWLNSKKETHDVKDQSEAVHKEKHTVIKSDQEHLTYESHYSSLHI